MLSLRSTLHRKLLTFFYINRTARVYVRQLAVALEADSTNLSRELARLAKEGLLQSQVEGRQLYYSINRDYPYLKPVFALLQGSVGIEPTLKHALQSVPRIRAAWIVESLGPSGSLGSHAKTEADASSDIDLLILGKPDQTQLAAEVRKAGKALRREVHYTVLTSKELKRRLKKRDPFVTGIWNGKRIELVAEPSTEAE